MDRMLKGAFLAIIVSLALIVIYVTLRFEFKFAVPVLIALVHDIFITLGIYWWVYCYKTSEEIKAHSGVGVGGAVQLILAIFIGIVPPFLIANDVKTVREAGGMQSPVSAVTALVATSTTWTSWMNLRSASRRRLAAKATRVPSGDQVGSSLCD